MEKTTTADIISRSGIDALTLHAGRGIEAFSTLRGVDPGDASGPYAGFNACHYVGDDADHVARCRRQLASALNLPESHILIPRQTHSTRVAVIGDEIPSTLDGFDALTTRRADIALCVNTADCLPIVFNDPVDKVIGIAHAGWKGVIGDIVTATIDSMRGLGADPKLIKAAIGPSICGNCYEVDDDFAQKFVDAFAATANLVKQSGKPGKRLLDLRKAVVLRLKAGGLADSSILQADACTRCRPDLFFSARALGTASGRVLTVIRMI